MEISTVEGRSFLSPHSQDEANGFLHLPDAHRRPRWEFPAILAVFGLETIIDQGTPCAIVNTGSKQGITCPPGDTAYNITKAGVKVLTEGLAHALRNIAGCQVTAHLLVPGSTFTGMTARGRTEKPPGSWTPEQVVDFMVAAMAAGHFYIICPDNDVTRDIDNRRILWAAEDIIRNRPALSRWHPDYTEEFAKFLTLDAPFRR